MVIGGDFNAILNLEEKYGGSQVVSQAVIDFRNWVEKNSLLDILTSNGIYTWNNKRNGFSYIVEELDRFFFKGDLSNIDLALQSLIMPHTGSDHYPVRLELSKPSKPIRNPFKCKKMWFLDPDFIGTIKDW